MLGAVQLCQLCVPDMVAAKFGRIVNVSSAVAMQPNFMGVDYSAAKAALNNYTVSLAGSLRGVNVTANVLTPGVIMVDGLVRFGRHKFGDPTLTPDEVNERLASKQVFEVPPAGRFGTPRELAMLGVEIDEVTVKFEVAKAKVDIPHQFGLVKAGTCGGQHYEWTAWVGGKPLIVYHFYWQLGTQIEPRWEEGEAKYRVRIHGDPPLECHLMAMADGDGRHPFLGIPWTGLVGCTVVPQVCDAPPGVVSHLDLGVVRPRRERTALPGAVTA